MHPKPFPINVKTGIFMTYAVGEIKGRTPDFSRELFNVCF